MQRGMFLGMYVAEWEGETLAGVATGQLFVTQFL